MCLADRFWDVVNYPVVVTWTTVRTVAVRKLSDPVSQSQLTGT